MATTHPTATRTSLAETIRGLVNGGSAPTLVIGTSSLSGETGVLVKITLADFGVAAAAVTTSASNGNNATATGTGTAAIAEVRTDPTGTVIFAGAVGVGSGEVQISSTSIASGDTVTLTSNISWTSPP